jgi:hypothetical protein
VTSVAGWLSGLSGLGMAASKLPSHLKPGS